MFDTNSPSTLLAAAESPTEAASAYARKRDNADAPVFHVFVMSPARIEVTTAMCRLAREKMTLRRFSPPF